MWGRGVEGEGLGDAVGDAGWDAVEGVGWEDGSGGEEGLVMVGSVLVEVEEGCWGVGWEGGLGVMVMMRLEFG